MKTNAEIATNLRRTKEILQGNGRGMGTLYNWSTECACLLGAVGIAVQGAEFLKTLLDMEDAYGVFCPDGAAAEEVAALVANLGDEYRQWLELDDSMPPNFTYRDVYSYNDNFAFGSANDQKVYDLIDRTVAALESAA